MDKKAITIVIPAHNESSYLPTLLDSIHRLLQDRFDLDIVVIDNGSTDATQSQLQSRPIRLKVLEKKVIPSIARNIGASCAHFEVMVFLDGDTELTQEWADRMDASWQTLADKSALITGARCSVPQNPTIVEKYWFEPINSGRQANYINGCNVITNRTSYDLLGGFDEDLETGEDVDFCNRARLAGITVQHDAAFKIIHHGYPKSLKAFVKREMWHAKGDLVDASHFLRSKVALASMAFLLLHVAAIFALLLSDSAVWPLLALLGIILLCLASALNAFRHHGLIQLLLGTAIYYAYLFGRSMAIFKRF